MSDVNESGISDAELMDDSGFPDSAPVEETPKPEEKAPETPADPPADEGGESEAEKKEHQKKKASERIRQLAEERNKEREARKALEDRIAELEKAAKAPKEAETPEDKAPDPKNYDYGALDDRYIQDMIEFKASQQINAHLTRAQKEQQEAIIRAAAEENLRKAQEKATEIIAKGAETYEDFYEVVVERGMNKEYPLDQETFEAMAEAEHGAEIAYALASDMAEAVKVSAMTPVQKAKYVFQKDMEIAAKKAGGRKPGAPPPASNLPRGSSGRFTIAGDTDDLDAFEKEFFAKK